MDWQDWLRHSRATRTIVVLAVLLAALSCLGHVLVGPHIYSPYASWCQTCTLYRDHPDTKVCTSWDMLSAMSSFTNSSRSSRPEENSPSILTPGAPQVPVWTATFRASVLNTFSFVPVGVFALMSMAGYVIRRCQRTSVPYSVFARVSLVCTYGLVVAWIVIAACILGFAAEATWEWQHDLRGGGDLCTSLCIRNSSSILSCAAEVAGTSDTFWQGIPADKPTVQYIGPPLLLSQLIFSAISLASFLSMAIAFCLPRDNFVVPDQAPEPQPWSGATPEICERIRQIPRELSPVAFVEALRNTRCREGLPDFIRQHARHVGTREVFTCPICLGDCRVCVDLDCAGGMGVAVCVAPPSTAGVGDTSAADLSPPADATLTTGPARHQFCPTCLALAIEVHPACPLCRRVITLGEPESYPASP